MDPYLLLLIGYIGGVIGGMLVFRPFKMFHLGYKSRKADKGFDCDDARKEGYMEGFVKGCDAAHKYDIEIASKKGFDLDPYVPPKEQRYIVPEEDPT